MKVLVTGGKGMLGRTLRKVLDGQFEFTVADLPEHDMTNPAAFDRLVAETAPDAVVHCAAMTAVDRCESERELAYKLNWAGSSSVASACHRHGVRLIAISTDYVFSGEQGPYSEFDRPDPRTVYGMSKLAGENAIRELCPNHLILRVAWLYGFGGPSFVHTMMKLADGTHPELKVVDDQRGNPTSAVAVSRGIGSALLHPEMSGTFHFTCSGEATWYEFAEEIFRISGKDQKVTPCTTAEFPRPADSRLDKAKLRMLGFSPMPDWRDALEEFMSIEKFI
ncbi:MAG: dTDP-4-dehydrorhamnose reductase [Victivallaceae bacterium]|nr:dTDP-4-dehydrorhamnose reductase [Victivallaceae bacterium]